MSSLDDLLSAAISEGKAALAEKKKPKVPVAEKRALAAKLLTEQTGHTVPPVQKGIFEITCLVAEYVRRTCQNCKHSELCSVPRVFICEQQVGVPTTRRLHRINNQASVLSHIQRGLPVKTEVFTSPAPFCKHCIKELLNARRSTSEGYVQTEGEHSLDPVPEPVPSPPGTVPAPPSPPVQTRSDQQVHNIPDRAGSASFPYEFGLTGGLKASLGIG